MNSRSRQDLGITAEDVAYADNDTLAYQRFIGPDGEAYIIGGVENFGKGWGHAFVVNGEILDVVLALLILC